MGAGFFATMWQQSLDMLQAGLKKSTAHWKIAITHYPGDGIARSPPFTTSDFDGLDLLFTGHRHNQETANEQGLQWIVSGGGGGITSDGGPVPSGDDDAYGFVRFTATRTQPLLIWRATEALTIKES